MQLRVHVQQEEARMANSLATSVVDFDAEVSILDMGVKFTYQVPSFSVLHVDLRQTKLQVTAEDGSVLLYDGFIRADPSLDDKETPYSVKVKDFCFVPVSRKSECNCKFKEGKSVKLYVASIKYIISGHTAG